MRNRTLRYNDQLLLQEPKVVFVSYVDRTFSGAAPFLWNKFPVDCRTRLTSDKALFMLLMSNTKTWCGNQGIIITYS